MPVKPKIAVHVGFKINRLTLVEFIEPKLSPKGKKQFRARWRCNCGNEFEALIHHVRHSRTKSCGCLQKEITSAIRKTHGMSRTPEYGIYQGMIKRCYNHNAQFFEHYGWRGISVCDRWRGDHGFHNFMEDMGPRPSPKHSIERVENNGNYEPENCIWLLRVEQPKNRRTSVILELNGVRRCQNDFADFLKINRVTVAVYLNRGWSAEQIYERFKGRIESHVV